MRQVRRVRAAPQRLCRQRAIGSGALSGGGPGGVTTAAPSRLAVRQRQRAHPVIEIFGPAIGGEGAEAGIPTHFVRLGGCDYRCSWCDTMYAVDPALVRENAQRLRVDEIVDRGAQLEGRPDWVTISGGNPALHRLDDLVARLQQHDFKVSVETQGSI